MAAKARARTARTRAARGGLELPWWVQLALFLLTPLLALNLAVAFLGDTHVFPLSPFFLDTKARALAAYLEHRPGCLVRGHPPLDALAAEAERRHRLPRGLLRALLEVESEGRVHRISFAGAMGPGQLMPDTARELGVTDPFDPALAVDGSARYLARQLARYRGNRALALAAYNAGPGSVSRWVPRNGETEHYVRRVLAAHARLAPPPPPARALAARPVPAPRVRPKPASASRAKPVRAKAAPTVSAAP